MKNNCERILMNQQLLKFFVFLFRVRKSINYKSYPLYRCQNAGSAYT